MIHYTAMRSATAARDWLCTPKSQVSAHYVIAEDGTLWHLVTEELRAWHAGAGCWGSITDVNSHSIGIELANTGAHPFPEPQMQALEDLLREILKRWNIAPGGVIGHSDMAPGRKIDPGQRFDWRRLARAGLAVCPVLGEPTGNLADHLHQIGYRADVSETERLAAFRLRTRPNATGPADEWDLRLAEGWARQTPFGLMSG